MSGENEKGKEEREEGRESKATVISRILVYY